MGFTCEGLGPADQKALSEIWPVMIRTLRIGGGEIQSRPFKTRSRVWFGDISPEWMGELQRKLYQMGTIANTQSFQVTGMEYRRRKPADVAHALQPDSGWGTYTNLRDAQRTQFRIKLDIAWNNLPTFRGRGSKSKSKFQTIVHEVSHLVLHTRDLVYGGHSGQPCKSLALNGTAGAKMNADNWAFFVDDVRSPMLHRAPDPIPSAVWLSYTSRSWHTRSKDLKDFDSSLAGFERTSTPQNRQALIGAFRRWYRRNPKERTTRNPMNVVNRMRDYVDSLELHE